MCLQLLLEGVPLLLKATSECKGGCCPVLHSCQLHTGLLSQCSLTLLQAGHLGLQMPHLYATDVDKPESKEASSKDTVETKQG